MDEQKAQLGESRPAEKIGPAATGPEARTSSDVALPLGKALTLEEAFSITSSRRAQLIMIAGPSDSGKSTLIASLFHLFMQGPFAGFMFAGSDTLVGFDQRCYLARTESGGELMDTVRTIRGEQRLLLHLRVCPMSSTGPKRDLLLCDLSGEDYKELKNAPSRSPMASLIKRADHFVLVVDGGDLSSDSKRYGAMTDSLMLLRSCLDSDLLHRASLVEILVTKLDKLKPDYAKVAEEHPAINDLRQTATARFAGRVGTLVIAEVAARAEAPEYPLGYGLDGLFPLWVEQLPAFIRHHSNGHKPRSEFDLYLQRQHLQGGQA